jgi:hypothetical protein
MSLLSPTSCLHDLVLDLDWAEVERHALHCPLDARYRSSDGNETPLYLALEIGFPPLSAVQALLRAYPEAAILPQTKFRYLPLHLACRFGQMTIKYAIIKELLFINSEDHDGMLQQSAFLPSVHANVRSRYGETPLSALADSFLSWYRESGTTAATMLGSIHPVQTEHWKCVHLVLQAACGHLDSSFNRKAVSVGGDSCILPGRFLDDSPPAFLPVHSALKLGVTNICPYHIVALAIEMCPVQHFTTPDPRHTLYHHDWSQQMQHTKDKTCEPYHGRLPIHIAITNAKSSFKKEKDYHSILCAIIDKCPLAASIADPLTKSYPLHLALSSSWFIHCPHTSCSTFVLGRTVIGNSTSDDILPWEPVLRKLCMAYPDAMEEPDMYTQLYPFAMVALQSALARDQNSATEQSYDNCWNRHVTDLNILTTIYELLLMKPHVLGDYCYP